MSKTTPADDVTPICVGTDIISSLQYYYARPTPGNDPEGEGLELRALVGMIYAPKHNEIKA